MEMNMTKFHERLQHPRPQMIRTNWTDLNGLWDFCFDDDNSGLTQNGYLREDFSTGRSVSPMHTRPENL